jgi:hypothetical protein
MTGFSPTEQLRAAATGVVVSIVIAFWKIGATISVIKSFIRNLQVGLSERRSERMTAPNSF